MAFLQDEKKPEGGPYNWPARGETSVIGKDHNRLEGLAKATGAAKYTYDVNLKNQLVARALGCPHAHCKIGGIDTSAAEKVPGVVHVHILEHAQPGAEINWQGELLAIVAAETEGAAAEGVAALKVDYELLESFTSDHDLAAAEAAGRAARGGGKVQTTNEPGDDEDEDEFVDKEIARLLDEAKYVVEGHYGIDAITHCCLEPHGSTVEWQGDKLNAYLSTQNVSGTDDGFANSLGISADSVDVTCNYIGGGFGSKFAADYWGIAAARISKETGRPVKLMLSRDQELKIGGNRPSGYIDVKLGADENGLITVWDSHHWGSSGISGGGVSHTVVPYVLVPDNFRRKSTSIKINMVRARAWRAPNHPQACAITQTAVDDVAAAMGKDSYDVFMTNLANATNGKADVYAEEMKIGAKAIDWKANWHPHGKGKAKGSVVEGLGMALHTWGGVANTSDCTVKIYPDGGVESFCGTQELGTGTLTVCAMVLAETFGLTVDDVKVNIGSSTYPFSGASGGSTTVGAVSESHRRASQDALRALLDLAATKLGVEAGQLEARGGKIQVQGDGTKSLSWNQACQLLGMKPLEVTRGHVRGDESPLSSSGVGGVQMAHVAVDIDTGVVKVKRFVAVQDQGLVINPQTCKSQIYGGVIMGIAASLFEQRIADPKSGAFVNAELGSYQLARIGDVGDIMVELYEPDSERERGVIGNGEPPAISPMAAISNAIANAIGVRVPVAPFTPKRVLEALSTAGRS
jgi:xanthine dehydrogenase YagR molybdenum-binding subunit